MMTITSLLFCFILFGNGNLMKMSDVSVIDINASALKLGEECKDLLAVHVLTTSCPFEKGKISALKLLKKYDLNLQCFGNPVSTPKELHIVDQHFFCLMYGSATNPTLCELHTRSSQRTLQRSSICHKQIR